MKDIKLTSVVLAKNEEENIKECIKQLSFCDEVVVIDDYSDDDTAVIAKELGANVYLRSLDGNYAAQRNFGLKKAKGEWVLFVDADESITKELAEEISNFVKEDHKRLNAAEIVRKNNFLGKKMNYGEFGKTLLLRLGRKGKGKWKRKVHEFWDIKGDRYVFKNHMAHRSTESLADFVSKLNCYSTLHSEELRNEGKRSNLVKIIFWPILKFIDNYLIKKAYKDKTHGFVSSMLMSFHSYLSWSKLWLKQRQR